ncbi:hypothetical protein HYH02_009123 [Chlamydomonas schloesseri]|uniref:EGF-like domain-containing protein n=1 Tax=Chlamydomonas schloesseri TaxID=2026947 RepID=A0A836B0I2_9CHLO|nr:hypothetical protein HYH02_009123 [Chlamydomonas schloesseri]|eukprot:KAG2444185.1 hypothetical protein HYH02_009123 [Chlamydomonas schloesseri]
MARGLYMLCLVALGAVRGAVGNPLAWVAADGDNHNHTHIYSKERKFALTESAPVQLRCSSAKGGWCEDFIAQTPIAWKTAPRGSTECVGGCNNVGRCNYDTGYCDCAAGWTGPGCKTRQKRPCTNKQSSLADGDYIRKEPLSHTLPDGRDADWTNLDTVYSRCGGICDEDLAICYCDGQGPDQFGRIPAPPGSPPGTPPIRWGRPLVTFHMAPKTTWDGQRAFGEHDYHLVYGPKGYCNVSEPEWGPNCGMDMFVGPKCDIPIEPFCPGACSGHGTCYLGYCNCDEGYYGHDCARRKAGLPLLPSRIPTTPWLASVVREPPAALEPPPSATRRRPLIYVYDLEPLYQARILQYRVSPPWCVFRRHDMPANRTEWSDVWVYAADTLLHELLLVSEHRTFDPEEADFFYVPHQASCLPFPIGNWADWPWFKGPGGPRIRQMLNMIMETRDWIDEHYPYWKRRGGRDHIWTFTHDEGACWAPNVLNTSIWLTHWGRMDPDHKSNTAFIPDSYDRDFKSVYQPEGYRVHMKDHPCYRPGQDLVIPAFKRPDHYRASPLVSATSKPRDIFFFFRGDVGKRRLPNYSRGIRQKVYQLAKEGGWREQHRFLVGDPEDLPGDYSDMLSRSLFCLVAAGDGWSARLEDAVLHGCIPVIVIDNVHVVFESILEIDSFAVRIPEADVGHILEVLQAIPERKIRSKQAHLGHVFHRYRYAALPGLENNLRQLMSANEAAAAAPPSPAGERGGTNSVTGREVNPATQHPGFDIHLPRPFKGDPVVDDAFSTIMQWLHSRIPDTRGEASGVAAGGAAGR